MRKTAALLLILYIGYALNGQPAILLTTHDQEPLTFINENNVLDGIALKPVVYALDKMGWKHEISMWPWARAQLMVKNGEADGFFAASQNTERDDYAVRSEPIATQEICWYLNKDSIFDPLAADFKARAKVSGYIGSNMLKWLQENGYTIVGTPTQPDQLFLMLANDRFDACLANTNNYENFIKTHVDYKGLFRAVRQSSNSLYIYFSKGFLEKNPAFLADFNKYIAEYFKENLTNR